MKQKRDTWLAIGLGLTLLLITIASVIQQTAKKAVIPYSSTSTSPDGSHGLYLWLDALDYAVSNTVPSRFSIIDNVNTTILLEPTLSPTDAEWKMIDAWVQEGGTFILAGHGLYMRFALEHYEFGLSFFGTEDMVISAQVPFLNSPPISGSISLPDNTYLKTERTDYVTLLAANSHPVIVTFEQGRGRIILSATPYPFTNAGLKEPGNPELVLNLITATKSSGTIWFDEWHHGVRGGDGTPGGIKDWLLVTTPGNAIIYAVIVIFVAIFLQGRHFGKPIPLPSQLARPAPIEYITAIANLNRRAGHQAATLQHYHQWLKRTLGVRYRINPKLADAEYLNQLSKHIPDSRIQELRSLFTRLRQSSVSEITFVRLAAEVSDWSTSSYES